MGVSGHDQVPAGKGKTRWEPLRASRPVVSGMNGDLAELLNAAETGGVRNVAAKTPLSCLSSSRQMTRWCVSLGVSADEEKGGSKTRSGHRDLLVRD